MELVGDSDALQVDWVSREMEVAMLLKEMKEFSCLPWRALREEQA